jgi:hypothetical protein
MGSQPIGRTKCVTGHSFFIIRSQRGNRCVGVPCPRCPLSVLVILSRCNSENEIEME